MKNLILFVFVIVLTATPLFLLKGAEFGGADGQAQEAILDIVPTYEPWFYSVWEPPSGEIESLLFSLQAVIGAIFIGYFIGFSRARKKYWTK